jgi:uroporphyrinogen decarboxylase
VEPLLVRAARREAVERTPVWFMRQAGRSLPEYREIRQRHEFFEINRSAELTAEVTLQPVRRHRVDAAVMFADIMTPVVPMGVDVELVEGVGPVVREPIRTAAQVERLQVPDPQEAVGPILEAIGAVRAELAPEQAVVGFCGGPFTVAGYLVEGKPSRDFAVTKALMYREPTVWHGLLEKLAATFSAYAVAQAAAGADAVQLFDSWAGALSPADYAEFAAPSSRRVLEALRDVGVPSIHFGTGTSTLLPAMAAAGGDVIGLDWRLWLDDGWALAGADRAVQGNLDPALLLGPWGRVEAAALDILARAAGRRGHIFNLGHGVLPGTDPAVLGRLRELVHSRTETPVPPRGNHPTASPA